MGSRLFKGIPVPIHEIMKECGNFLLIRSLAAHRLRQLPERQLQRNSTVFKNSSHRVVCIRHFQHCNTSPINFSVFCLGLYKNKRMDLFLIHALGA